MKTTQLKDISLSTEIMDACQTSSFTEETYELKGSSVHLSGDKNIGNLQLSGNLIVGNRNEILISSSMIVGNDNIVGAYGYNIVSNEYNKLKNTTTISVDTEIDQFVDEYKPIYSVHSANASLNLGRVISVDFVHRTMLLENEIPDAKVMEIFFLDYPHIGNVQISVGTNTLMYGKNNIAVGNDAFAGGFSNVAGGNYAHVEGKDCLAAWGCHVEGCQNEAYRECSHVEGRFNISRGLISTSKGGATHISDGCRQSEVGGYMALASSDLAYVWNGAVRYGYQGDPTKKYDQYLRYSLSNTTIPSTDIEGRMVEYMHSQNVLSDMYHSHGQGTYNVNPEKGLSGFYIGEKSLYQHIVENRSGGAINVLSGKTYSKLTTDFETIIYDIAEKLGATITE